MNLNLRVLCKNSKIIIFHSSASEVNHVICHFSLYFFFLSNLLSAREAVQHNSVGEKKKEEEEEEEDLSLAYAARGQSFTLTLIPLFDFCIFFFHSLLCDSQVLPGIQWWATSTR